MGTLVVKGLSFDETHIFLFWKENYPISEPYDKK